MNCGEKTHDKSKKIILRDKSYLEQDHLSVGHFGHICREHGRAAGSKIYSTDILANSESGDGYFDDTYTVALKDDSYGEVSIAYADTLACYVVHADFKKQGTTELLLTSPEKEDTVYQLMIGKDTYQLDCVE